MPIAVPKVAKKPTFGTAIGTFSDLHLSFYDVFT